MKHKKINKKYTIIDIQNRLHALNFNTGVVDGVMGPITRNAIKAFQLDNGLVPDGIVGKKTAFKLFKNAEATGHGDTIPTYLPWLHEAYRLINTQEIRGKKSNNVIMRWAQDLNLYDYHNDDIPWCGLFVAHAIRAQLPEEPLPNAFLGARNWQKFGRKIAATLGAVGVFWRQSKKSWLGHVGFYAGEDKEAYHILGGNQSNAVNIKRIKKSRLLSFRYPKTALKTPLIKRVTSLKNLSLSVNEA